MTSTPLAFPLALPRPSGCAPSYGRPLTSQLCLHPIIARLYTALETTLTLLPQTFARPVLPQKTLTAAIDTRRRPILEEDGDASRASRGRIPRPSCSVVETETQLR